jgi:hypothetical protein
MHFLFFSRISTENSSKIHEGKNVRKFHKSKTETIKNPFEWNAKFMDNFLYVSSFRKKIQFSSHNLSASTHFLLKFCLSPDKKWWIFDYSKKKKKNVFLFSNYLALIAQKLWKFAIHWIDDHFLTTDKDVFIVQLCKIIDKDQKLCWNNPQKSHMM